MDALHLSDFREMRLKSKGDFDIAYSAVMGIGLDAYLQKLRVSSQGFDCANFKAEKSLISRLRNFIALTGSSNTLKEQDNISPDHSYSFPMKFGQNFQKTLLVILQLQKRYRNKLHIA